MDARFRLRRREDFARLRRHGRTYRRALLSLSVVQNEVGYNRYGFITSKQLGRAVTRNRVRRRLREAIRLRHADVRPGFDILWIARSGLVDQPWDVVVKTVDELYRQAGLLKDESA
ncbi:MAG: ribonuclease P protein component [Anaerolineae bacterium]|nr:ribonuclease P protein component [Anaerolineae bacterium]